jgi:hypothetical protein
MFIDKLKNKIFLSVSYFNPFALQNYKKIYIYSNKIIYFFHLLS